MKYSTIYVGMDVHKETFSVCWLLFTVSKVSQTNYTIYQQNT